MTPEREKKLMQAKDAIAGEMKGWCDRFDLTAPELLALCAYMTGACIANQDQRTMTSEKAMEIVSRNIEVGNASAISEVLSASGRKV